MDGAAFLTYVQDFLCPTLKPGDVVIADNLSSHKVAGVQAAIEAVGASIRYLPPYSPDLNPIEQVFAKLKTLLRQAAKRTIDALRDHIGSLIDAFAPDECRNYIAAAGYVPTQIKKKALYVNWYRQHMMGDGDNPPIGILLCTDKNHTLSELDPDTNLEMDSAAYEWIKNWLFEALAAGRLTQAYAEAEAGEATPTPFVVFMLDALHAAMRETGAGPGKRRKAGDAKSSEKTSGPRSEKSSEKILALLHRSPRLSAREVADKLGLSPRAVEKHIAALRKAGRLKRIGPAKGGHWETWSHRREIP